jgi:hypothetical protein
MTLSFANTKTDIIAQTFPPVETGYLPQLDPNGVRDIYETGTLVTGQEFSVRELTLADAHAIFDVFDAEYNNPAHEGKDYLIYRSLEKFQKMLRKGDHILGVVIDGRLAAVGAVTPVADKDDMGRGKVYDGHGACPPNQQIYFKAAVVHPSLQKKKLGLMEILYPHRVCKAANYPARNCLLTKTNNLKVQNDYEERGWTNVDQFLQEENDRTLYTYKTTVEAALDVVQETRPDIYARHLPDIEQARMKAQAVAMTTSATETSNDNNPAKVFVQEFIPN